MLPAVAGAQTLDRLHLRQFRARLGPRPRHRGGLRGAMRRLRPEFVAAGDGAGAAVAPAPSRARAPGPTSCSPRHEPDGRRPREPGGSFAPPWRRGGVRPAHRLGEDDTLPALRLGAISPSWPDADTPAPQRPSRKLGPPRPAHRDPGPSLPPPPALASCSGRGGPMATPPPTIWEGLADNVLTVTPWLVGGLWPVSCPGSRRGALLHHLAR